MHESIASAAKLFNFNRPIHRSTSYSQFLAVTRSPTKCANLIFREDRVNVIVRSLLQHLKVVSDDLPIRIELYLIFCFPSFVSRFARQKHLLYCFDLH